MDPLYLQWLLTMAMAGCHLSPILTEGVRWMATQSLLTRWPLAGCAVTYGSPTTQVVCVGLN